MKKIIAIIAVLMFAPALAFAQTGLNVGDTFLSFTLGGVNGINEIENSNWGNKGGLTFGAQIIDTVTPNFAFGIEVNQNNFVENDNFYYYYGDYYNDKIKTSILNLMFAGRLYLNQEKSRVYIPMGFGLSVSTLKINILENNVSLLKEKERASGFGWYAGLGFEAETSENVVFGIEARINGNSAKIDMLNDTYHPLYLTVMARLGFKFQ